MTRATDHRADTGVVPHHRADIITAAHEWARWFASQLPSALNGGAETWEQQQLRRIAARKEWIS